MSECYWSGKSLIQFEFCYESFLFFSFIFFYFILFCLILFDLIWLDLIWFCRVYRKISRSHNDIRFFRRSTISYIMTIAYTIVSIRASAYPSIPSSCHFLVLWFCHFVILSFQDESEFAVWNRWESISNLQNSSMAILLNKQTNRKKQR
jgi:hypothetical protein